MIESLSGLWAILPDALEPVIRGALKPEPKAAARRSANPPPPRGVAVVPLTGIIMPRSDFFGTSARDFRQIIQALAEADDISGIVLDVHSPGGLVWGVAEAAEAVRQAAKRKPVVAVANSLAASAAYWIASQAGEVVISPSAEVGSIGVYLVHVDISEALKRDGVKATIVKAGKHKTTGNPYQPLTDEARDELQASINESYDKFVSAVALGRNTTEQAVRDGYGEGRAVGLPRALDWGLADRVATVDQVIAEMAGRLVGGHGNRAESAGADKAEIGEDLQELDRRRLLEL